jgi:hypothetical protein
MVYKRFLKLETTDGLCQKSWLSNRIKSLRANEKKSGDLQEEKQDSKLSEFYPTLHAHISLILTPNEVNLFLKVTLLS